jgi:hypothetical protein
MGTITNIVDNQQITTEDFQNLALDPQNSMDAVVNAAIEPGMSYWGAQVTISGTTKINVATPMLLFAEGAVYDNQTAGGITIDFIGNLPLAGNQTTVAIVLQGQTEDTDTEARDFVVDATTTPFTVEAQPTATRVWRACNVAYILGAPAPAPSPPAIPTGNLLVAYVTLSSTQVVSVSQVTANQITSLSAAVQDLLALQSFQAYAENLLNGLRLDVANLQNNQQLTISDQTIGYILQELARCAAASGVSESASYSATDFLLDTTQSDLENLNYNAMIMDGIRFPYNNISQTALQLLNSLDSNLHLDTASGLILPAFSDNTIISVLGKDTEVSLSSVTTQTVTWSQNSISRTRIVYGNSEIVCTNSSYWQSGSYDPLTSIFTASDGETFNVQVSANQPYGGGYHTLERLTQFWEDSWTETYWQANVTSSTYTGVIGGNTFLMPQTAWVQKLRFGFSRLDSSGDVKVLLCGVTAAGTPDLTNVYQSVLMPYSSLVLYPAMTSVAITPTLLTAGTRYAIVLITTANHWVAQVTGNKYAGGTFFQSTDDAWFQGSLGVNMCFEVVAAQFSTAPIYTVTLQPWNLEGGMTDIKLLLTKVAPDPASITFEYQLNNVWYPIAPPTSSSNNPLYGQPAAVSARMTFQGTADLMPGIVLQESWVYPSAPKTSFTHISVARDTPTAVTHVEFYVTLGGFDPTHHTCTADILVGSGFTTSVAPSSTSDETMPDGTIKRTFVFTGLTSTSAFKRKIMGTTDTALDTFFVGAVTDVAFPS